VAISGWVRTFSTDVDMEGAYIQHRCGYGERGVTHERTAIDSERGREYELGASARGLAVVARRIQQHPDRVGVGLRTSVSSGACSSRTHPREARTLIPRTKPSSEPRDVMSCLA
jgi:hypothetical protein